METIPEKIFFFFDNLIEKISKRRKLIFHKINKKFICFREIKWFFQRGYRGWADCDIWSFDTYLSKVIYSGLIRLKEKQNILPTLHSGITEEDAQKEWDFIMNEVIYAFKMWHRCANSDAEFWYPDNNGEHALKPIVEEKYPDIYLMSKEDDARMKNGMKLFIEHFGSFWD